MSSNPNLNRTVQQVLYQLNQEYGNAVTVYKLDSAETDYATGEKQATKSSTEVRHCIVLPAASIRKFFQSITYITESKPFSSQGGQGYDETTRGFIFSNIDLKDHQWEPEDWIVYKGRRYDVSSIMELEDDQGWMILGKHVRGADPEEDIRVNVTDNLIIDEVADES